VLVLPAARPARRRFSMKDDKCCCSCRTGWRSRHYLRSSRGIILPIGSTEQHGATGVIGTDAICAEIVARGVGEAAGALVTPTIAVGMAQHHLGFAGSITRGRAH
jgi:creatinine amidohydrolase/Fe(II)-dependent formamide hydrolase-like protein